MKKFTFAMLAISLLSLTACKIFPWEGGDVSRPMKAPPVPASVQVAPTPVEPAETADLSNDMIDAQIPEGFTIASRDQDWIKFTGTATVSGEYYEEPNSVVGDVVCFNVDAADAGLVPRHPERDPWFCFANQQEVKKQLGIDDAKVFVGKVETITGKARVTVSNYQYTTIEGESWDIATMDELVSSEPFDTIESE